MPQADGVCVARVLWEDYGRLGVLGALRCLIAHPQKRYRRAEAEAGQQRKEKSETLAVAAGEERAGQKATRGPEYELAYFDTDRFLPVQHDGVLRHDHFADAGKTIRPSFGNGDGGFVGFDLFHWFIHFSTNWLRLADSILQ